MTVQEKIKDMLEVKEKLTKMMDTESGDCIAFARMCGQIEQMQRDQEQIEKLKAEIAALRIDGDPIDKKAG